MASQRGNGNGTSPQNTTPVTRRAAARSRGQRLLGWREWVAFPEHGALWIKAKVDTGARTSAIHARNVKLFLRNGQDWVRFTVLPWQSSTRDPVLMEAPLEDQRWVRSSSGQREFRPVVLLPVQIAGTTQVVEFTLSHRPQMGFRILLGRQALRGHYAVDPAQSYLGDRPPAGVRAANEAKPAARAERGGAKPAARSAPNGAKPAARAARGRTKPAARSAPNDAEPAAGAGRGGANGAKPRAKPAARAAARAERRNGNGSGKPIT